MRPALRSSYPRRIAFYGSSLVILLFQCERIGQNVIERGLRALFQRAAERSRPVAPFVCGSEGKIAPIASNNSKIFRFLCVNREVPGARPTVQDR